MKKVIKTISLILVIAFSCNFFAYADFQQVNEDVCIYTIDTPYECPVEVGTDEWKTLSVSEKYNLSYVDSEVAKHMTTDALLQTVVNYPFISEIYCYDSVNEGIEIVRDSYPPLNEFLGRDDATDVIFSHINLVSENEIKSDEEYKWFVTNRLLKYLRADTENEITPTYFIDPSTGERADQITTPKGSFIIVYANLTWDDHDLTYEEAYSISIEMEKSYGVEMIREPSPSYNCHSYAWYSVKSNNPYWLNSPEKYIRDGSYVPSAGSAGRKITYEMLNVAPHLRYVHSGIVNADGTITSKWGCLGLFSHKIADCPYYMNSDAINYWKLS